MPGPPTRNSYLRRDVEHPGRPEPGDGGHDRKDVLRDRGLRVEGSNAGTRMLTRPIAARHKRPYRAAWTAKNLLLHFCLTIGHKGQPPGARIEAITATARPLHGHPTATPRPDEGSTQRSLDSFVSFVRDILIVAMRGLRCKPPEASTRHWNLRASLKLVAGVVLAPHQPHSRNDSAGIQRQGAKRPRRKVDTAKSQRRRPGSLRSPNGDIQDRP